MKSKCREANAHQLVCMNYYELFSPCRQTLRIQIPFLHCLLLEAERLSLFRMLCVKSTGPIEAQEGQRLPSAGNEERGEVSGTGEVSP